MITVYSLLLERCGLSHREAAEFHNVRLDTVKSWSSGRNPAPAGALAELRALYARIEKAANELIRLMKKHKAAEFEIGLASDDYEARQPPLNWPCVGSHAAAIGLAAARTDKKIIVVPRGSTAASAAAADVHDRGV